VGYEQWLQNASSREPDVASEATTPGRSCILPGPPPTQKEWCVTHESYHAEYLLNNINMGVRPTDKGHAGDAHGHVNPSFIRFPYTLVTAPGVCLQHGEFRP
jgi:hypothetical protein